MRWVPGTLFQRTNRSGYEAERLASCSVGVENTRRYAYTVRDMRFADYTVGEIVPLWFGGPKWAHCPSTRWQMNDYGVGGDSSVRRESFLTATLFATNPSGNGCSLNPRYKHNIALKHLCVGTPLRGAVWVSCAHLCHYSELWITDLSVAWGNVYWVSIFISTYEAVRICGCFV